jgi:hypothetical protein
MEVLTSLVSVLDSIVLLFFDFIMRDYRWVLRGTNELRKANKSTSPPLDLEH